MIKRTLLAIAGASMLLSLAQPAPASSSIGKDVAALAEGGVVPLALDGFGVLTLKLQPNPVFAPGVRFTVAGADGEFRDVPAPRVTTWRGSVVGDPTSDLRLTVTDAWYSGIIETAGKRIEITPNDYDNPTRIVAADARKRPQKSLPIDDAPTARGHGGREIGAGVGNCVAISCGTLTALVILDGDVFFRSISPNTCLSRLTEVFNAADLIYGKPATRIKLKASQLNCRTTNDLQTDTRDAQDSAAALRLAWQLKGADRSFVYLMSGVAFQGSYIGYAYQIGGVCKRVEPDGSAELRQECLNGYAVGQKVGYINTLDLKARLFAHEAGHLFNAQHETSPGCSSGSTATIMCPAIHQSSPQSFSSASAAVIRRHAEDTIGYVTTY